MKHKNTDSDAPHNWRELVIFSLVFSLSAIVVASIALEIPYSEVSREVVYNKTMTLVGIIVGVFGVAATVYFVVMGIDIHRYKNELDYMTNEIAKINAKVDENKEGVDAINSKDTNIFDVISVLEAISKDEEQTEIIRLALGRMICKSKNHTKEYPLEMGIRYLGQYSRSPQDNDILKKIIDNTNDEKIKKQAYGAIEKINSRL